MPVFTTLKCMISLWRDMRDDPEANADAPAVHEHEVELEASGEGGAITQDDIDV